MPFYNQQATMGSIAAAATIEPPETENEAPMSENLGIKIQFEAPMSDETSSVHAPSKITTVTQGTSPPKGFDCPPVEVAAVLHAKFSGGKIVKLDKAKKYLTVSFSVGEILFTLPNRFNMGFLKLL